MSAWGLDIGTANTAISRWNQALGRPELVELPDICRAAEVQDALLAPKMIPSATHCVEVQDMWSKLGRWPFFAKRVFWGRFAWIGRQALERNLSIRQPAFAPSFKRWLGRASSATLAHVGSTPVTAREVTRAFLRELFAEVYRVHGERIRDLVITTPVDTYESYRAELSTIARELGVSRVRFADEPVAAALGYGLGLSRRRDVIVVDFGAGTLDLALVRLTAREMESGRCEVLGKAGRSVGGDHVDQWILERVCASLGSRMPEDRFWRGQMLDEARRVKELAYVRGEEVFHLLPPQQLGATVIRIDGIIPECKVDQAFIRSACEQHGLPGIIADCVDELAADAARQGLDLGSIDDVLMVGGSTLLPGVFTYFEERFGRDRVRPWRPFDAVAFGASALASDTFQTSDFIVHDYAILTHHPETGSPEYTTIVPRGTRFPTAPDFWKRALVPTCALGEPETIFKLVICEMGAAHEDEQLFGWDAEGEVKRLNSGDERLVVPLNEQSPTLGRLTPPHEPGDRSPRLDVSFSIDQNRWLVVTVYDRKTQQTLLDGSPVVRLL